MVFQIDATTAVATEPTRTALGTVGHFSNGDPGAGVPATIPGDEWFNMVQNELLNTLSEAGITPDKADDTQLAQAVNALIAASSSVITSPYYNDSAPFKYVSASQISIARIACVDSTNSINMIKATATTIDITASGVGGLATTASESNNTWYYPYAIANADGTLVSAMLSPINVANSGTLTGLPSGYTKYRQLPFAVRNDGSGNFIPFVYSGIGEYIYNVKMSEHNSGSPGPTNIAVAATYNSFTDLNLSNFVPPISQMAIMHCSGSHAGDTFAYRADGETHGGTEFRTTNGSTDIDNIVKIPTSSSQVIEAIGGLFTSNVFGFVVTEVM